MFQQRTLCFGIENGLLLYPLFENVKSLMSLSLASSLLFFTFFILILF